MDSRVRQIVRLLRKHGARKVELFGSYARGEARPDSDIDVLVDFKEKKSLLEIVGIEQELEEAIGVKVDLLTRKWISPYLLDRIEQEAVVVFDDTR
ncbi:MAG: nucleotidyltransferase family protein [Armatimonadota bacterium]